MAPSNEIGLLNAKTFMSLDAKTKVFAQVFVSSAETATTRNGGTYLRGTLGTKSGPVEFKKWGSNMDSLSAGFPAVYVADGKVDEYNGMKSFVIDTITPQGVSATPSDFMEVRYDRDELESQFIQIMKSNLSEQGYGLFEALYNQVREDFVKEFAARSGGKNHDNVLNGLLAHSLKCLMVLDKTIDMYDHLMDRCNKDLLYIGVGLHDIGKVTEYTAGTMSPIGSLVSHRSLAIEMITRKRKGIISLFDEDFYYRLMSIFAQHHGEYEEKPRTVEALIVHYVDNYEAQMASLNQNFELVEKGATARHHGFFIS